MGGNSNPEVLINGIFSTASAVTIFVLVCLIYYSGTNTHGAAIHTETEEWSKGVITDVTTADSACPSGYEQVTSKFFGTETICKGTFTWSYGACTKSDRKTSVWSTTVYGLSEQDLFKFDGKLICVQRSKHTYHDIVKGRNQTICGVGQVRCGPTADTERQFCFTGTSCPLNAVYVLKSGDSYKDVFANT